jgi:Flp pilus assembly protein TadG
MLALLGATVDIARVFQTWIALNGAVRDAAEVAALETTSGAASTAARRVVCLQAQGLPGFTRGTGTPPLDIEQCAWPQVTTTWSSSTTAVGATTKYPIGTATVQASFDFEPLVDYPFITNDGTWNVQVSQEFSVVQGR